MKSIVENKDNVNQNNKEKESKEDLIRANATYISSK